MHRLGRGGTLCLFFVLPALTRQAWISLAAWIAFGLLLEGLIGYRIPALLDDPLRREMFRLAHSHGTLLNLVLFAAAIGARLEMFKLESGTAFVLRAAVVAMPAGFLFGGLWHFKGDPGLGIVLVPIGAVMLLWAAIQIAFATK